MDARWTLSGVCAAVSILLPAARAATPQTSSQAPAGTALSEEAVVGCAGSVRDQASGGCMQASSTPEDGMLFPPPHDGGSNNSSGGLYSFVGGGASNDAEGTWAVVGGGFLNTTSGNADVVAGGFQNGASGAGSTISGGVANLATGYGSTIPGGANNVAAGVYSFAAGLGASASHNGSFVWSDGTFSGMQSTGNNQFLINAAGGVGIGTNDPQGAKLNVAGSIRSTGPTGGSLTCFNPNSADASVSLSWLDDVARIRVGGNGPGANGGFDFQRVGNQSMVRITDNRRVGIANAFPSERLDVNGNICATGTIGVCSDERYKTDVEDLEDALSKVLALRGVEFDWRHDAFPAREFSEERQVGLIAQEVLEVVPQVVSKGGDGMYSVDYGKLTPILIEAIREQQAQAERQRGEIAQLRDQMAKLRARVSDSEGSE